ncbi:hypothetical protein [Nocardiopsis valliformis]|uniref:hypothetical protein n=1 Tax=Nocardiopsis valliformis TaxID=239974 RepID=UPI00034C8EE1|nr:hypothetical protein [Nocardiopsis valliformis]
MAFWGCFLCVWLLAFSASYVYNGAASFSQQHYREHRQAERGRGGTEGTAEGTYLGTQEKKAGRGTLVEETCSADFVPADGGDTVRVVLYLPGECVPGEVRGGARLVPVTESRWDPTGVDEAHVPGARDTGRELVIATVAALGQLSVSGAVVIFLTVQVELFVTAVRDWFRKWSRRREARSRRFPCRARGEQRV